MLEPAAVGLENHDRARHALREHWADGTDTSPAHPAPRRRAPLPKLLRRSRTWQLAAVGIAATAAAVAAVDIGGSVPPVTRRSDTASPPPDVASLLLLEASNAFQAPQCGQRPAHCRRVRSQVVQIYAAEVRAMRGNLRPGCDNYLGGRNPSTPARRQSSLKLFTPM